MSDRLTDKEVLKRFKYVHGDRYDYSLVEYKNSKTKVKIICSIHGVFEQTPEKHCSSQNCPKCNSKNVTNEEFIEKSIKKHGNKYDYKLVFYKNSLEKVKIICDVHGVFEQMPKTHLKHGCVLCGIEKKSNALRKSKEQFINQSIDIHKNKYNYSKVEYKNTMTKVEIICPNHGIFEQIPNSHLRGDGCNKCGDLMVAEKLVNSKDEFVILSNNVHGNIYDYSKVEYKNSKTKVKISCYKHGIFEQTPNSHLRENGCPVCKSSKGEKMIYKILNNYKIKFSREHKFENCKNLKELPYDFYLKKYNTCIEFHGNQHFEKNDFFGGEIAFLENKKRDEIKEIYCKDNNIPLVIIFILNKKIHNYVDFYGDAPIQLKNILLENKILEISKYQYDKFKKKFK
jgi:hypothetical protein